MTTAAKIRKLHGSLEAECVKTFISQLEAKYKVKVTKWGPIKPGDHWVNGMQSPILNPTDSDVILGPTCKTNPYIYVGNSSRLHVAKL